MTYEQAPWEVYRDAHDDALTTAALIPPDAADVFRCGWLVEAWFGDPDCGYEPGTRECGAVAWDTGRGWECASGHEHVTAEARHAEGWDYFTDDEIAGMLAGHGPLPLVEPRHMDGSVMAR